MILTWRLKALQNLCNPGCIIVLLSLALSGCNTETVAGYKLYRVISVDAASGQAAVAVTHKGEAKLSILFVGTDWSKAVLTPLAPDDHPTFLAHKEAIVAQSDKERHSLLLYRNNEWKRLPCPVGFQAKAIFEDTHGAIHVIGQAPFPDMDHVEDVSFGENDSYASVPISPRPDARFVTCSVEGPALLFKCPDEGGQVPLECLGLVQGKWESIWKCRLSLRDEYLLGLELSQDGCDLFALVGLIRTPQVKVQCFHQGSLSTSAKYNFDPLRVFSYPNSLASFIPLDGGGLVVDATGHSSGWWCTHIEVVQYCITNGGAHELKLRRHPKDARVRGMSVGYQEIEGRWVEGLISDLMRLRFLPTDDTE
jgi:hypothetical protein